MSESESESERERERSSEREADYLSFLLSVPVALCGGGRSARVFLTLLHLHLRVSESERLRECVRGESV